MNYTDPNYLLYRLLMDYKASDIQEEQYRLEIIKFLSNSLDPFNRENPLGHITGSALVVDQDISSALLTHHRTLDKWFKLGGHVDENDHTPIYTGLREANEESGLQSLHFKYPYTGIFDVTVDYISHDRFIGEHNHLDVIILLLADINEPYQLSVRSSKELKWVKLTEAYKYNSMPSFLRLIKKAQLLKS
jgi:8-oxo-dGTP pyrophosphatase MutT (NUDIX family)